MKLEEWRIEELTGYQPITTFYMDFSIADKFGINAIKDTYQRAFKEWNHDYAETYDTLWRECDGWCIDNLKEEELEYYYKTTD